MATGNITLAKGSNSVTLQTVEVDDNYANKVIDKIPTLREPQQQSLGPRDKIIIDLLDITHEMLVRGEITPTATNTAEEVRDKLITIMKGSGISSGTGSDMHVTVTYGNNSYDMFITKLAIKEKSTDFNPASDTIEKSDYQGASKYSVQITLLEGVSAV